MGYLSKAVDSLIKRPIHEVLNRVATLSPDYQKAQVRTEHLRGSLKAARNEGAKASKMNDDLSYKLAIRDGELRSSHLTHDNERYALEQRLDLAEGGKELMRENLEAANQAYGALQQEFEAAKQTYEQTLKSEKQTRKDLGGRLVRALAMEALLGPEELQIPGVSQEFVREARGANRDYESVLNILEELAITAAPAGYELSQNPHELALFMRDYIHKVQEVLDASRVAIVVGGENPYFLNTTNQILQHGLEEQILDVVANSKKLPKKTERIRGDKVLAVISPLANGVYQVNVGESAKELRKLRRNLQQLPNANPQGNN